MKKFKDWKIAKAVKASFLCLKFPFLYPRNRYTDTHVTRMLGHWTYNLRQKSTINLGVTCKLEKENKTYLSFERFIDINVKLNKDKKILIISNKVDTKEVDLKRILWDREPKFTIIGVKVDFALTGRPIIMVMVKTIDESDKTNYGFCYDDVDLLTNKRLYRYYKILSWIDAKILDKIFFIPTYTELDAMPSGWRKAFGIQMCQEIKDELKKHKGALKRYRIMQIKEKFGGLRWYDNGSTEKIWKEIIPKYTDISYKTCINCGKPAEYISNGWVSPYCSDCINPNKQYTKINEENAWDKALDSISY